MEEKFIVGIVTLVFGILLTVFNKFFGRIWWLGMPSVQEIVTKTDKEKRYEARAALTRVIGIIFIITGLIFTILSMFY